MKADFVGAEAVRPAGCGAPVTRYSCFKGPRGTSNDYARAVAVDLDGNAYVTGDTGSPPGDFSISVKRADLPVRPRNPLRVGITCGEGSGVHEAD